MVVLLIALLGSWTLARPAADPIRPPAGGVSLTSLDVDLEGSGCQPGDASVAIARDNSALTIIFDKFEAADGPKAGTAKSRAFCRITVGVNSPGYAFDITSADFRGYVMVEKGVEASLVSRWKWVDKNGVDLKGKVSQCKRQELRVATLIVSRAISRRSSMVRLRTMCSSTRMVSFPTMKHQFARSRTRRYRSVFPQPCRQALLRRTVTYRGVLRTSALGKY
tara:strand:+ start:3555 stop:4220 length:666 start_codon:yes stop_codon:yes gene_type:complete